MTQQHSAPTDSTVEDGVLSGEWWGPERFLSNEVRPEGPCPDAIDITGIARFLVYGPYVPLAPGVWRAVVSLHLCPDASRRLLAVQFGAEPHYDTVELPARVPGSHTVAINHVRREAGLGQIRLWLKRPAFHGEVRFEGASIRRLADLDGRAA
jgi:hypothetical protein